MSNSSWPAGRTGGAGFGRGDRRLDDAESALVDVAAADGVSVVDEVSRLDGAEALDEVAAEVLAP